MLQLPEVGDWPGLQVDDAWQIDGGRPIARLGGQTIVGAMASYEKGAVMALGFGSAIAVTALFVLGMRLALGRGLPAATSRFWFATPVLLIAVATVPPLWHSAHPETFGFAEGVCCE